jgi:small subunit ribosomal protein S21
MLSGHPAAVGARRWVLSERDVIRMIRVEARGGEPLEKTLRRFKKQCEKEGLTKDIKKTSYYEKPSERKRRRLRNAFRKDEDK